MLILVENKINSMTPLSSNLHKEIIMFLAKDSTRTYNLEDLSKNVMSNLNFEDIEPDQIRKHEAFTQSKVLEALILLDNDGLVVLNSETDEFFISNKGIIENCKIYNSR